MNQPKKAMNEDHEGTPVYRCELCGGVTFKIDSKITVKTLSAFIHNGPAVIAIQNTPRVIIHRCPNGGRGFAPMVGIVPDEVLKAATDEGAIEKGSTVN